MRMFTFGILLAVVSLLALTPWSVHGSVAPRHVAVAGGPAIAAWRFVVFMCMLVGVAHPFAFVGMMTTYSNLVPKGKQVLRGSVLRACAGWVSRVSTWRGV